MGLSSRGAWIALLLASTAPGAVLAATYTYDAQGRLVSVITDDTPPKQTTFTYDDAGNRSGSTAVLTTATVTNHGPHAVDDTGSVAEHVPPTALDLNVLGNDTDIPDGYTLSIAGFTQPQFGTVVQTTGHLIYTPLLSSNRMSGIDVFSYTVSDGHGGYDSAVVNVALTNSNPTANNDSYASIPRNLPYVFYPLTNDTDPGNDPLSVEARRAGRARDADARWAAVQIHAQWRICGERQLHLHDQ